MLFNLDTWYVLAYYVPIPKSLKRSFVVGDFYGTGIEIWAGLGPVG